MSFAIGRDRHVVSSRMSEPGTSELMAEVPFLLFCEAHSFCRRRE